MLASPSKQERFYRGNRYVAPRDSGSTRCVIREEYLPSDVTFSGKVTIWCVHNNDENDPLANVTIEFEGQQYLLSVGVMDKQAHQVVLGTDLPILWDLIARAEARDTYEGLL